MDFSLEGSSPKWADIGQCGWSDFEQCKWTSSVPSSTFDKIVHFCTFHFRATHSIPLDFLICRNVFQLDVLTWVFLCSLNKYYNKLRCRYSKWDALKILIWKDFKNLLNLSIDHFENYQFLSSFSLKSKFFRVYKIMNISKSNKLSPKILVVKWENLRKWFE